MAGHRSAGASSVLLVLLGLYASGLLSIGLLRDWRLLHEDNGALHTTLALSHVRLGLARTRAHDLFFDPHTAQAAVYGHHPPGVALLLAGVFALTGSDAPGVARLVPIAFQVGSVFLMVRLLACVVPWRDAVFGGFAMATLPMSAYFGRMVNYEPLGLFAVLVQLNGYAAYRQSRSRLGLVGLASGVVLGGLIDWAPLFFAGAIAFSEIGFRPRWRPSIPRPAGVALVSALAIAAFDLWHLSFAAHGAPPLVQDMLASQWPTSWKTLRAAAFASSQIQVAVHYFTRTGLTAAMLAASGLLNRRVAGALGLTETDGDRLFARLLAISGGASAAYVLAAPAWAAVHAYWQFYALPFVVSSMVLLWRRLCGVAVGRHRAIGRILLTVSVIEVVWTSATTLHYRHTRPSAHAVGQTSEFRAHYLAPVSHGRE